MQRIIKEFEFFFFYETALHYAANGRNSTIIKILLENGANPDISNNQGEKPAINVQ